MLKRTHKRESGFTIIEIVIVLAISSLILLGLMVLYNNYYKVYNSQEATARVVSGSALIGSEIQNTAKQANAILASRNISGTVYTTNSNTVVFSLPAVSNSGSLIPNEYDYVVFYINGTKLYKLVSAHANSFRKSNTRQLSDVVGSVNFSYNNGDFALVNRVDVAINMQITIRGVATSHQLQQTLFLFNAR